MRQGVEVPARRPAEHRDQRRLGQPGHLAHRGDAAAAQLGRGDRADPPEALDREGMEELELALRVDDEQAVGLGHAARHLGEELGPGHAHGYGQPNALGDLPAQPHCDLASRARDPPQPADVEERLVDRQALDQGCGLVEHLEHRLAGLRVGRHARLHDNRPRAQPARLGAAHGRTNPERLGLIAGGEHDAPADDDGTPAQAGIVPLLDRRVEGVEVGVQDRGLAHHEHMFPQNRSRWRRRQPRVRSLRQLPWSGTWRTSRACAARRRPPTRRGRRRCRPGGTRARRPGSGSPRWARPRRLRRH